MRLELSAGRDLPSKRRATAVLQLGGKQRENSCGRTIKRRSWEKRRGGAGAKQELPKPEEEAHLQSASNEARTTSRTVLNSLTQCTRSVSILACTNALIHPDPLRPTDAPLSVSAQSPLSRTTSTCGQPCDEVVSTDARRDGTEQGTHFFLSLATWTLTFFSATRLARTVLQESAG